jgi:hypothetical protein
MYRNYSHETQSKANAFLLWTAALCMAVLCYFLPTTAQPINDNLGLYHLPSATISPANNSSAHGFSYNEEKDEEVEQVQVRKKDPKDDPAADIETTFDDFYWPASKLYTWANPEEKTWPHITLPVVDFDLGEVTAHVVAVPKYVLYQQWRIHLA